MTKHFSRLAGLTLLFGTLCVPAAHADTRFDVRIGVGGPPVVAYVPPPGYGYIWQPGYYVRVGYGRRWVPGGWIRPAYDYRRPGWANDRRGYDRRDWGGYEQRGWGGYDRRDWDRGRRSDREERRDHDWRR